MGVLWIIAPLIAYFLSKEIPQAKLDLNNEETKYILEIGKKTWDYFSTYMTEETNFLPPDNYQENRKEQIVYRTSSTNIGLGILSVISAFDLKFISLEQTIDYLRKIINTIQNLAKWNGHLYNWYNIKTLEPLYPRYVSTVDSGNFIGYMYTLKQFLIDLLEKNKIENDDLIKNVDEIINNTNFSYLYDSENAYYYYRPSTPSYYSVSTINSVKESNGNYTISCTATKTEDTELSTRDNVQISLTSMPKNKYFTYKVNKVTF